MEKRLSRIGRFCWRLIKKIVKWTAVSLVLCGLGAAIGVFFTAKYLEEKYDFVSKFLELPDVRTLKELKPIQASYIYDEQGNKIACFAKEYRRIIPQDQIPPLIEKAILASEDKNFYSHYGIDPWAILRAARDDLFSAHVVAGGSTLTQQVAKGMFLTPERTMKRKAKEAILALKIERYFTKKEILWLYVNMVYLGHGRYGFETASQFYFGKSAQELILNEAAMLAGLINNPERSSPYRNYQAAFERKNRVLRLMLENGFSTEEDYQKTSAEKLNIILPMSQDCKNLAPYFVEEIRRKFGDGLPILSGGLNIFTSLNMDIQKKSEEALHLISDAYRVRHPENADELRGGVVVIDLQTGAVVALQGGEDFEKNQYSSATQARRQPGSAFKPFTYATAVEINWKGPYGGQVLDRPVVIKMGGGKIKIVQNYPYERLARYVGITTFETAISQSRNAATVWLAQQVGIENVIALANRLGIDDPEHPLQPYPTTAIGASEVTLLQLTAALMPMMNGGYKIPPYLVKEIIDGSGKTLYKADYAPEEVLSEEVAEKMKELLKTVVDLPNGTAHRLRTHIKEGELAGKTGTATNEKGEPTDNWFIGFTSRYAIGVWIGLDSKKPLGTKETGATNALPVAEKILVDLNLVQPDEKFRPIVQRERPEPAEIEKKEEHPQ
ncbi:MAG: transglycosylase domain-containing protein [Parcubacteria group bacterium]|nr:transglycosylase domain-containing protein [Parcubacteria group bacterium]